MQTASWCAPPPNAAKRARNRAARLAGASVFCMTKCLGTIRQTLFHELAVMNAHALVSIRWLRRLVWGLAALLTLWALAWAAVPPLATRLVQSRLSEVLGRQVTVGSMAFSPWSLEITVRDLAVVTADGQGVQLAVERLYVDAEAQSLLRWAPVIDAVTVDAPTLQLTHLGGGRYDIDDIVQRLRPPDDAPDTPVPRFALYNLSLHHGRVDVTDRATGAPRQHTVRDLQLSLPFVSSFDSQREVVVAPRLAFVLNGSPFDSQAQGTPFAHSRKADVALQVRQLDLAPYLPYLPATLPVRLHSAVVDADLRLGFVQSPQTAMTLSGALTVSQLAVQDTGGKPLFAADRVQVALADVRPLERSAMLSGITVQAPLLHVVRSAQGQLNLAGVGAGSGAGAGAGAGATPAAPAAASAGRVPGAAPPQVAGGKAGRPASIVPPAPWRVQVGAFTLDGGQVVFADYLPARPVHLELRDLHVAARDLHSEGRVPTRVQVAASIGSGHVAAGSVRYGGTVAWAPMVLAGDVELVDVPAHALVTYADIGLRLDVLRADANFKGRVRYAALPQGPEFSLQGDAALEDFRAQTSGPEAPASGQDLLSWKALNVPGIDLRIAPGTATQVRVREALLSDFYARLIVSSQGRLNLQDLGTGTGTAPPNAEATATATAGEQGKAALPALIQMGPISMVNGRVLFSDRFIQPNYTANLSDLNGRLSGFSSHATGGVVPLADLELRGRAQGTASLEIVGKLNPLAQPLALDIEGRVRDLELPPLSPYAAKYAGYGIERGKLRVDVHYTVQPSGQLVATNKLVLHQLSFGDKVEGAATSLPVKLAVALLADRHGVIDVDLPISGSLNDPQFRLGPVIWKVITNLVSKALTAPFSLLASALGDSGAGLDLGNVPFAPGSAALGEAARTGLDAVAQALRERPTLRLTMVGQAHLQAEQEALTREKLRALLVAEKRRMASSQGQDPAAITDYRPDEMPTLLRSVYRRADIAKPRNLAGLTKDIAVPDMEALLLPTLSATDEDLAALALQRAVVVKEYLAGKQIPTERLFLGAAKTGGAAADAKPQTELEITGD